MVRFVRSAAQLARAPHTHASLSNPDFANRLRLRPGFYIWHHDPPRTMWNTVASGALVVAVFACTLFPVARLLRFRLRLRTLRSHLTRACLTTHAPRRRTA
jgi:hypothetical protein